jgi:hypothetical protein
MVVMTSLDPLRDPASALVEAAEDFQHAAEHRGSHLAAPASLESLQEALQVLSAAWYQVAADASAGIVERERPSGAAVGSWPHRDGLSREQEVRLLGALHDVAAAFARCARSCREGRSTVTPIIARSMRAGKAGAENPDDEVSWFASTRSPSEHVA